MSVNRRTRREHLADLAEERRTMIFYEAPHKLLTTLTDLLAAFGDRRIVLARELTSSTRRFFPPLSQRRWNGTQPNRRGENSC